LEEPEITDFEVNSADHLGNPIKITCVGVDDNELAHFGGLDLHVKAVKILIQNTHGMSFAEQAGDFNITDKVIALYLNQIGQFIKDNSSDDVENVSNMDLIKYFMDDMSKNKAVMEVIDRENQRNAAIAEEQRKEDDALWDRMNPNSKQ
jgi:hypothetical protein